MSTLTQFFPSGSDFKEVDRVIKNNNQDELSQMMQHYNYQYALVQLCNSANILEDSGFGGFIGKNLAAVKVLVNSADTWPHVVNSQAFMNAAATTSDVIQYLANSQTAMNAIVDSQVAMHEITNSQTAMNVMASSEIAMKTIGSSQNAMNIIALSSQAVQTIWDSSGAIANIRATTTGTIGYNAVNYAANEAGVSFTSFVSNNLSARQLLWICKTTITPASGVYLPSTYIQLNYDDGVCGSGTGWYAFLNFNDSKHYILQFYVDWTGSYSSQTIDEIKISNADDSNLYDRTEAAAGANITVNYFSENGLKVQGHLIKTSGSCGWIRYLAVEG